METGHNQLDAAVIQRVIKTLEHVSLRPGMWFGVVKLEAAMHFTTGFAAGLHAVFDLRRLGECRKSVVEDRYQIKPHTRHLLPERIRERFPEDAEAGVEWIAVELEAWKRLLDLIQ